MKATFISREKDNVKFTMEFTKEEFEEMQVKAYQANKDKFEINGFRKGKAPRSIIEKHYGEGVFFEDAIDELFSVNYPKAIEELGLEVIDRPGAEFSQIKKGEGFTATITVLCFPEVEIKDYKGVQVEEIINEISDEDIENEIKTMQERNARMILVERPAKEGDTLLFDYSGFVGEVQFEGGTAERQKLTLGSNQFIPGFEEQLIGVTPGERKDVVVTFPEEYHAENLAGKEAVFHCLVHEIEEKQLPEIDDDFAQDVSEFDTLVELKASIRTRLEEYAKRSAENQMKDKAVEEALANNEIEALEPMVYQEMDTMMQQLDNQLRYQGLGLEQYFQYMGKDFNSFREEIKPDAERSVKIRIMLENIAKQENLKVSDEELEKEFEEMAKQYNMPVDKLKEAIGLGNLDYFKKDLVVKKAIDLIFKNATIKTK